MDRIKLKDYLTSKEAAEELGITDKSVQRHIKNGRLEGEKVGGRYFIHREDLAKFKPNLSGRPRASVPQWHFPAKKNELVVTTIEADLSTGVSMAEYRRALAKIKSGERYLFPGTIARYIWF